jgi:hypothetical protein
LHPGVAAECLFARKNISVLIECACASMANQVEHCVGLRAYPYTPAAADRIELGGNFAA